MTKKIITVLAVLLFAAVLFYINSFSVYADDYLRPEDMTAEEYQRVMTNKYEFEQKYLYYVSQYEHGYMTHSDFVSEVNNLTEEYVQSNTNSDGVLNSIARNVSNTVINVTNGISNAVGAVGEGAKDIIDDVLNPYECTETVPTVSTNGYGCYAKKIQRGTNLLIAEVYCEYGVIESDGDFKYYGTDGYGNVYSASDGSFMYTKALSDGFGENFLLNDKYYYEVYGDVRYSDGTQAPTNDEYVDMPVYDFSTVTDSELDDILNELNETLKLQTPDLSTMEGLLESIYYRLGQLDSDDDNGLLNQIIISIDSLRNSIENLDFGFDTENEFNFEDLFGDFEFNIDFSDFFIDFEANISLYFVVEEGYFDNKITELKNDFDAEFAFINNISSYVKNFFNAFDALWEDDEE